MDNTRPRTSSFSRTPHRPQRPTKIMKSIWVKKGSTVGTQAVLPQTVKESAMMKSESNMEKPKGLYLDSVNRQQKMKLSMAQEDLGHDNSRIARTKVTRKVQDCLHVNFLENQENQKGKGPDWMFDLELLTPSMNYIPVRKENYADSGGQETACNDVEDLDDQQFIVHGPNIHATQNKPSEERTADKEIPLTFLKRKRSRIEQLENGKECVDITFTSKYANTPASKYLGNTPTDISDDDIPKDGVFSTNSFDDENTDTEEGGAADYNNMDPKPLCHLSPNTRNSEPKKSAKCFKQMKVGLKRCKKNCFNSSYKRIEAIRLFLAFASFMGFTVYQMDVKSAFLYGNITEEVYVKQPPGFEDPAHPNKVYRVVKALYGLHQAPRVIGRKDFPHYFFLKHGYRRGAIDKTLFIKKDRRDIMLVQVYVDDIIFGSTKSSMVKDFEDLMQKKSR
ncbi:putative ribonuclease H-like domain-containing protein [Tanacetum coccineum]|uniref:Ribonuclease H-like domain-containing protein n=1 Tax=Tanacetum coccineum TaxID=301880 RepID=A0ABQ5ABY5_9ASTR